MRLKIISQFKQQIRQKHIHGLMEQTRKKYREDAHPHDIELGAESQFTQFEWIQIFGNLPPTQIPARLYRRIDVQGFSKSQLKAISANLDAGILINVLFMTEIKRKFNQDSPKFLQESIEKLSSVKKSQFQTVESLTEHRNYQEIYLGLWCQYLNKDTINASHMLSIYSALIEWWNDEEVQLSYGLVSEICCILIIFNEPEIARQISYIATELIKQTWHRHTYNLVAEIFCRKAHEAITLLCLEPCFLKFLLEGLRVQTLNSCLKILNFYQHTISGVIDRIIPRLQWMILEEKLVAGSQKNIIGTFYNIISLDLQGTETLMKNLRYSEIDAVIYTPNKPLFFELFGIVFSTFACLEIYQLVLDPAKMTIFQFLEEYLPGNENLSVLKSLKDIVKTLAYRLEDEQDLQEVVRAIAPKIIGAVEAATGPDYLDIKSGILDTCNSMLEQEQSQRQLS